MTVYRKLVRDRIPAIIRAAGDEPVISNLEEGDFKGALLVKLQEETLELCEATDRRSILQESADVREVLLTLCDVWSIERESLGEEAVEFTDVSLATPRTALLRRSRVGLRDRSRDEMQLFLHEYYGAFLHVLTLYDISIEYVVEEQEKIRATRGGFNDRIFLIEVRSPGSALAD